MEINSALLSRNIARFVGSTDILPCEYRHVLIACMPKAASRRLLGLISSLTDFEHILLNETDHNLTESLDSFNFLLNQNRNWVAHHHVHCAFTTPIMLKRFSVDTIVLTRNLMDVCASLRDHLLETARLGGQQIFGHLTTVTRQFVFWEEQQQYDFIIDMIMPWYVKFYASWQIVPHMHQYRPYWLSYDDLINAPYDSLSAIYDRMGLAVSSEIMQGQIDAIDKDRPNFNKGVSGRGEAALSGAQKRRIADMCAYYPDVNFSKVGVAY